MKPRKRDDIEFQSTLTGKATAMTIDAGAMAHVMSMLSDLYKNPVLAVIREYSTNAWDAQVEAGVTDPIEITTPSRMSPFLRIKDKGVGLSEWEIHNIYSKYGTSTKTGSDDLNGMLGIGCKSAFAYTSQFTVVSVKNGIASRVSISKDENEAGVIVVEDTFETDQPSGTTVEIPTRVGDEWMFKKEANFLFSFWQPGTVLVDGAEPDRYVKEMWVNDQFSIIAGDTNYIVMGNVPYAVPRGEIRNGLTYRKSLVVEVPIGSVDILQNRELLKMTAYTKEALEALGTEFREVIEKVAQDDVDDAPNRREAMIRRRKWLSTVEHITELKYKGEDVPLVLKVPQENQVVWAPKGNHYKITEHRKTVEVDMERAIEGIYFYNYHRTSFTPTTRKKLDQWVQENLVVDGVLPEQWKNWTGFVLTKERIHHDWIPSDRHFDFEEVAALKLPRTPYQARITGRRPGAYDALINGERFQDGNGAILDEIPYHDPVFYFVGSLDEGYRYQSIFDKEFGDDGYSLVALTSNRVEKFIRERPKAKSASMGFNEIRDRWIANLPKEAIQGLAYRHELGVFAGFKNFYYFDDPELVRALEIAKADWSRFENEAWHFGYRWDKADPEGLIDFHERYPMVDVLRRETYRAVRDYQDHLIDYVNAMYHTTIAGD